MATQSSSPSLASRVLERIAEERFTGLLRVSAREATGEFWFLAGILDEGRFGASRGDEARQRLLSATEVTFQAELRLPHVSSGFKKPMPASGSFAEFRPVALLRHCESYALTCSLELRGTDHTVMLTYRAGDLLSVDAAAGNDALPALLESDQGTFEFSLPTFELSEGSKVLSAPSPAKTPLAERIDRLLSGEAAAAAEAKRKADEAAAAAEAKRKADEAAAAAEAKRKADEAAAAVEAKRKADQAAAAEAKRKADQAAAAEAKRKADEAAAVAARKKAEQAAAAEAKRQADEAAAAEAKRQADEAAAAEAKRQADEAAAAEAKRQADEAAAADAKRQDEERAVAASKSARESKPAKAPPAAISDGTSKPKTSRSESTGPADEQLRVPTRRGVSRWHLLLLALVLLGLAYFIMARLMLV